MLPMVDCAPTEDYSDVGRASTIRRRDHAATHVTMDRELLGRLIRERREAQGLTLRALAERAGVSHAYIGAIEKASNHGNVTVAALDAIATGLGGELSVSLTGPHAGEPFAGLDPNLRDLVQRAALALAALPADEMEQEARILELRAARHVREPAAPEAFPAAAAKR